MLRRSDGTPYQPSGSITQFNSSETGKYDLFNRYGAELFNLFGSPIYYFEIFISFANIDKLYLEDRSKIWSQFPVELFAVYEPVVPLHNSDVFGINSMDQVVFELNYSDTLKRLGSSPKIGARIQTPHKQEHWVIVDKKTTGYQYWGESILQLYCQRFSPTRTDNSSAVPQPIFDNPPPN